MNQQEFSQAARYRDIFIPRESELIGKAISVPAEIENPKILPTKGFGKINWVTMYVSSFSFKAEGGETFCVGFFQDKPFFRTGHKNICQGRQHVPGHESEKYMTPEEFNGVLGFLQKVIPNS